jgi:AhpD family alkylhydroperoxidase
MNVDYPDTYRHYAEQMQELGKRLQGPMSGFGQLHSASVADGALSSKVKELIALAIGITVRCNGCIAFHVHAALGAGATADEVLETIGVAVMMGGGPSVIYGIAAMEALDQFEKEGVD